MADGSRITMTPARVAWHNMIIHPIYGLLWAIGARNLADAVHEWDISLERGRDQALKDQPHD